MNVSICDHCKEGNKIFINIVFREGIKNIVFVPGYIYLFSEITVKKYFFLGNDHRFIVSYLLLLKR